DAPIDDEIIGCRRLFQVGEMRALNALLTHPDVTGVESQVETGRARTEHHHAAALADQRRDGESGFTGMFEDDIDVLLAGNIPDRLAELAGFLGPLGIFRRIDLRQLTPAFEVL